jgi:hypothetical protein
MKVEDMRDIEDYEKKVDAIISYLDNNYPDLMDNYRKEQIMISNIRKNDESIDTRDIDVPYYYGVMGVIFKIYNNDFKGEMVLIAAGVAEKIYKEAQDS